MNDESREKFPFYAKVGVGEVWLIDRAARSVEVYVLRGETYFAIAADRAGVTRAPALDLELATIVRDGEPRLRIAWAESSSEI